jgi:cytochrome P450
LRTGLAEIFGVLLGPRANLGLFVPALSHRARWNLLSRPLWALVERLDVLLHAQIAATRADPSLEEREDVLALLVVARDEQGVGLTDGELRDELITLVTAGHETTATAIAWGADLLAHAPDVATTLRERLADGDRDYLKATAKEVLRVRTVAPISAARHSLEPFPIDGWLLGPDAAILVNAHDLHGDPELHPEPEAFRPQRFLDDPPDGYAYLPFGGGAHRCIGSALATLELELALEAIVTGCTLSPAGPPATRVRRGVTMAPGNRGAVRVTRLAPRRPTPHAETVPVSSA